MSKVKTAVCLDENGNPRVVECRIQENWHGAESLQLTKERIALDHPAWGFDDWVYDMSKESARNSLRLCFLSPSVWGVEKWVLTEAGIEKVMVTREEVAA